MKILAIRGKNLASLAGEFAVDFQAEPLAGAGLFAITGATGAGKSSLLDALCLALYERTPRLARASAKGESIPDVGDERVGPGDPRNILRRGAADGFAEVDFVGSDAVAYRARWSVRRARNKADGKLQQSDISLARLVDGQVLGDHRKTETLKLIERCIGLNFEQFTRAVLLAQNDFAAFLKASDDERAELLQTLTGTETFTQLSMQAYARAKSESETLKQLNLQLADQAPLSAEARAAKEGDSAAQAAELKAFDQRKAAIEGQLRWQQQGEQLQAKVTEAASRLEQAQQAKANAAERAAHFARIEAVQAARPLAVEVERLNGELAAGTQSLKDGEQRLVQAAARATAMQQAQTAAAGRVQAAEQASAQAQPALDQVKALDAQIVAVTPNYQAAVQARNAAKLGVDAEEARRAKLQGELERVQAARLAAQRWLDEHAARRPLAEGWQRWETLLTQASARLVERNRSRDEVARLTQQEEAQRQALAQATAEQQRRLGEQQVAQEQLRKHSQSCAAVNAEELARQQQATAARREQLAAAARLWHALGERQEGLAQLEAQKQARLAAVHQGEQALRQSAAAKPLLERDLANAEKSLRIAELAASANVEQLRAALENGEPCPVCGAAEHPYAEHHPQLAGVLDGLRQERERCAKALSELLQGAAAAEAAKQGAQQQLAQLERDLATATAAWQGEQQQWAALPLAAELDAVAAADRTAWLSAEQALALAAAGRQAKEDADYRAALRAKDVAQAAVSQAQNALTAAQQALAAGELAHQKTAQARQAAGERLADIERQLLAAQAELDGAFPDAGWRAGWLADAAAFVAQCRAEVEEWAARQRQVAELTEQGNGLNVAIQGALEACAKAAQQLAGQDAHCQQLERDLQAKQAQRQQLFEGRAVAAVEAALRSALEQAKVELNQRQVDGQQAEAERARQQETQRQTAALLDKNRAALQAAELALSGWLAVFNAEHGAALAVDVLKTWLALPPAWLADERQALQAVDAAIGTATALCNEHRQALAAHLAVPPADGMEASAEQLREALAKAQAELEAAQGRAAALQLELAQDNERRQKAQALLAAIEQQGGQTRVWAQLSELIGSADGKKFRNFAQQLTLDILLGYANRHLETLSRRYRLQRIGDSLGLLVVDQDMGDELRSVHSLSGGESFLLSLALALGLASLSSHRVRVESLFIDEGFGSLDSDALIVAMEALDKLQAQGRKVGVISHVQEMTERIGTRIQIKRLAGGQSRVVVV
jgi:exonuclease SbcC